MKVIRLPYVQLLKHFSVDQTVGLTDQLTIALTSAMPLLILQTCTTCDSSSVCGNIKQSQDAKSDILTSC